MKALAITRALPADHPQCFVEIDVPDPVPGPRDLLVRVKAVSVNPVDTKVRRRRDPSQTDPQILGWDASGIVEAVGREVSLFRAGDEVFYAGDITRPGSNAGLQAVDERIVGGKPRRLSHAEAAALPLTALTAWEMLFERLRIPRGGSAACGRSLLILGGAGGVGSIAIQLARRLGAVRVIASASRPESAAWCRDLGAEATINHQGEWPEELAGLGFPPVEFIACLNDTAGHWERMAQAIAPLGTICSIVECGAPLDLDLLKSRSAAFAWEFMFTRSMFQTEDMVEQHRILTEVARLVDEGQLQSTVGEVLGALNPANLAAAHLRLESGRTIGKLVLTNDQG